MNVNKRVWIWVIISVWQATDNRMSAIVFPNKRNSKHFKEGVGVAPAACVRLWQQFSDVNAYDQRYAHREERVQIYDQ